MRRPRPFPVPAAALAALFALPLAGHAQERGIGVGEREDLSKVALVIGNGAYHTAPLRNPPNDARDMARTLRDLGFDVMHRHNTDLVEMKRAVREFGDRIRRADVALFYYAGHGVQSEGRNYLIPVGAVIDSEPEVEYESVDAGFVIAQMEAAGTPLNIVILDACRNNPFARSFRSATRGLTQVTAPTGTLIAYATAPGSVASDGDGENGLYTQELLRFMRMPGLSVEEVFKQVRISLNEKTDGDQTPWESSSLVGDFYFTGPPEPPAPAEPAVSEPTVAEAVDESAAGPTAPPVPATVSDFSAAFDACMEPLATGDAVLFERRFAGDLRTDVRAVVRRWLEDAPRSAVVREGVRPGVDRLDGSGSVVAAAIYTRFSWRSGFGVNREVQIPIEAVIEYRNGAWVLGTCRVAGSVDELR